MKDERDGGWIKLLWFFIILGIFLLLFIITITKLSVNVDLYHTGDDDNIRIKLTAWFGLIRYTIKVPLIKVDKETPGIVVKHEEIAGQKDLGKKKKQKFSPMDILLSMRDTTEILKHVINLHTIIRKFFNKISITKFEWHTTLGIGDAAQTGVLAGLGWSIKGTLLGILSNYMKLMTQPVTSITPSFQIPISQTKLSCIFHFRIGHAMLVGIRLIKYWRGGLPNFKKRPLSMLSGNNEKSI
ncbi:DUF2953 domain-containing protein [Cytobacillus sp. S13-E01]|nr:DUF2953 domain-containing protein [Cytobacillus sp. S13-E01]